MTSAFSVRKEIRLSETPDACHCEAEYIAEYIAVHHTWGEGWVE